MKEEALSSIHLVRNKYYTYAYCYLGNHAITIDLRKMGKPIQEAEDGTLKELAEKRLADSIIFDELK